MGRGIFILVLLALGATQVTCQVSDNQTVGHDFEINPIIDGVLVTGGEETLGHIASWTVLVTLDVPKEQIELLDKLNTFQSTLAKHDRISNITKSIWQQRITDIKTTINDTPVPQRNRRGLINFIGVLSNKLFGTATEDEVSETRKQIESVGKQNKRVVNVVKDLMTIVNQTHEHSKQVNQHIESLEHYVLKVAIEIQKSQNTTEEQNARYDVLDATLKTDRALALIEATHNMWLRQLDTYNRQRAALELGYLTEDILPVRNLRQIIANSKRSHLHAPPLNWYYSHVHIQPLWQDDKILVFRANLPLTDQFTYLRYHIRSWAIPGNSSEFKTQLQVPKDIAFHTETGGIFEPTSCLGARPSICRTGPVYDRSKMQCARGIVTGETRLRSHCLITITRGNTDNISTVQELSPGEVTISTDGENMSLVCAGQAEKRIRLSGGLYILKLPSRCRINGQGWTLTGMARRSIQSTVSLPVIQIAPFNLTTAITEKSIESHLNSPHWAVLAKVKNIKLSSLNVDPNQDYGIIWGTSKHSILWTIVGILILVIVIIVIVLVLQQFIRRRRVGTLADVAHSPIEGNGIDDGIEMVSIYGDADPRARIMRFPIERDDVERIAEAAECSNVSLPLRQDAEETDLASFRRGAEQWVKSTKGQHLT